jgi:hypothetical protein
VEVYKSQDHWKLFRLRKISIRISNNSSKKQWKKWPNKLIKGSTVLRAIFLHNLPRQYCRNFLKSTIGLWKHIFCLSPCLGHEVEISIVLKFDWFSSGIGGPVLVGQFDDANGQVFVFPSTYLYQGKHLVCHWMRRLQNQINRKQEKASVQD